MERPKKTTLRDELAEQRRQMREEFDLGVRHSSNLPIEHDLPEGIDAIYWRWPKEKLERYCR